MVMLIEGVQYRLVNPESEAALEKMILNNYEHIFGPDSFYFNLKRKIRSSARIGSIPDGYVIFFDPKPKWCVLEVELSSHPIYDHLIPQLTKFNRGIDDSFTRRKLVDVFYATINDDEVLKARIKQRIGSGEIYKFVSDVISTEPIVVVAIDERTLELQEALRDIRGDVRVLEFKTFRRVGISDEINAYVFNPIVKPKLEKPETAITAQFEKPKKPSGRVSFVLRGREFPAQNARGVLIGVLEKLSYLDPNFIERFTDPALKHGSKRRYVARTKEELYPGRPDLYRKSSRQLKSGYWVGLNHSVSSIRKVIEMAAEVAGLEFGSELIVHLE